MALDRSLSDMYCFTENVGDGTFTMETFSRKHNTFQSIAAERNRITEVGHTVVTDGTITMRNLNIGIEGVRDIEHLPLTSIGEEPGVNPDPLLLMYSYVANRFDDVLDSRIAEGGVLQIFDNQGWDRSQVKAVLHRGDLAGPVEVDVSMTWEDDTMVAEINHHLDNGSMRHVRMAIEPVDGAPWAVTSASERWRRKAIPPLREDAITIANVIRSVDRNELEAVLERVDVSSTAKHRVFFSKTDPDGFVICSLDLRLSSLFTSGSMHPLRDENGSPLPFGEWVLPERGQLPVLPPVRGFGVMGPTVRGVFT